MEDILETLDYIKGCIKNRVISDENKISLKKYCVFFEKEIENHLIEVELSSGKTILVNSKASHVAHIMELHEFYDPNLKHKILRFSGSFSTIQGFLNMKKEIITIETLKNSKKGKTWNKETTKYRVLCFPFLNEALLHGTWYTFDINKYSSETKLIPKFIVNYRVQNIQLNFCIDINETNDRYFCISNIIAYKTNSRIENQDCLDIDRIIEYLPNNKIKRCMCHNRLYGTKLKIKKACDVYTVNEAIHNKLIDRKCFVNTCLKDDNHYEVKCLKLDSNIKKYIK